MKRSLAIALLSVGLLSANAARADDSLWGAVIGGGAGALIGQSVAGRNGAVLGGAIGAAVGVSVARDERPVVYDEPRPVRVVRPVVVQTVPVRYVRGEWAEHRHWEHERRERGGWDHEGRWQDRD